MCFSDSVNCISLLLTTVFLGLCQLYLSDNVNYIFIILCERQGLTINQLRGGSRGACKVPGAAEQPQATVGRVRRWETGDSQVNLQCTIRVQLCWVPRKRAPEEAERVRGNREPYGRPRRQLARESDHLLVPEGGLQVTVGGGRARQPGLQGAVDPQE